MSSFNLVHKPRLSNQSQHAARLNLLDLPVYFPD